jgi:group II intron reverse transcriptase/maturase
VKTRLQRIAELARERPEMVFTSLSHVIDIYFLEEAHRRTRKDGAVGVDGRTADEYGANLRENLLSLLDRFKAGTYQAPPVRRVHIPKGDGTKTRPIGVPTFEDKVLQRAGAMVLEAIYEQEFRGCSWGFRPGRSAHQALEVLRDGLMDMHGGWVVELDIQSFYDTLEPSHLRSFLDQRVRDGVLRRMIDKWLKAGVLEEGSVSHPDLGTPQGGVISPILANIYLHHVLDVWFEDVVKPLMKGQTFLVRYADDAVIVFAREGDARKVMDVLPQRFGKYGLTLHPEKTRLIHFPRPPLDGGPKGPGGGGEPETFDLLGFTHYWCRTMRGKWAIRRRTAKSRLTRALKRITGWCRGNRHRPVAEQREALAQKLRGHYQYYGVPWNGRMLLRFRYELMLIWWKWLNRRSQRGNMAWEVFEKLLERYPLPEPVIAHRDDRPQRIRDPRSRMR